MTPGEIERLSKLCPPFQERVKAICQRMVDRGYPRPYIGSTARTPAEQLQALQRGTTGRKQKWSWHFVFQAGQKCADVGSRAVDFRYRMAEDKPDPTTQHEDFFRALYDEATWAGCRSLAYERDAHGRLKKKYINGGKLWDAGHVEWREPYATLEEAVRDGIPELDDDPPRHDPDDLIGLDALPKSPFV